ncbi:MAG: efflux RND transporter periplasmic adaptor subunit [Burkholderiaceae bacterium]|nr:efflux RND transporter periplasmic adaptor subunit [Burkholderiaceae bacterium]
MALDATRALAAATLLALALSAGAQSPGSPATPPLPTAPVASNGGADLGGFDGVVQAVRQTTVAAQVPGAVVALHVKAGEAVKAGQVLLRLDARAAEQTAAAGAAQVQAARAAQEAATKEFQRQQLLFQTQFISQAALDRAEAQHKAAQAEASAQLAAAGAARTQSDFYVVKAPYDGVVSDVAVVLGDMAMPGRALLSVYDPRSLRVSVAVPQSVAARMSPARPSEGAHSLSEGQGRGPEGAPVAAAALPQVELAGFKGRIAPLKAQLLPTVDPATHTLELRLDLPSGLAGVAPGMFARAWLPLTGAADTRLYVPARAVVRRAEMTAVYVVGSDGRPLLRQVRLGREQGDTVEVLAGVSAGEQVVLEPQAAARQSGVRGDPR